MYFYNILYHTQSSIKVGLPVINRCLLLSVTTLLSISALAQLPGMKVYTQLDGFPGTSGYRVNQDPKGFIWVATDNGAACFDGKKFRIIDDKDGLSDKELLQALPFGGDCVLFVPLLNNLTYYKNGKVITGNTNKTLAGIKNFVTNFCRLDEVTQKIWVGDAQNKDFIRYLSRDTIEKVRVHIKNKFAVEKVINNQMYYFDYKNVYEINSFAKYDLINHTITTFEFAKTPTGRIFEPKKFGGCEISNDGKYFIVSYLNISIEVFKIYGNQLVHIHSIPVNNSIRLFRIDGGGNIWIGKNTTGIEYWGPVTQLNKNTKPLFLFQDIIINDLFTDRDKNLWFTTEQKGLFFISAKHWENAKITMQKQIPLLPPRYVTGNNNTIFIGHRGKPCLTLIRNGKTSVFNIPEGSPLGIRQITVSGKRIFVAAGLLATLTVTDKNVQLNSLFHRGALKDIAVYDSNHLILAQHGLVEIKNIAKKEVDYLKYKALYWGRATAVAVLPDSSVLIGTPNGLHFIPTIHHEAKIIDNQPLNQAHITDIEYARNNNILVGTNAQGLYNYNYRTGKVNAVLPENVHLGFVRNIFKQNDSIYWISTDKGAHMLTCNANMQIQKNEAYTFFDGLPSSDVSAVYVQNDTAYFATATGMGIIPLKNPSYKSTPPVLWITDVRFDDSVIHFPKGEIQANYRQNNFQLSLSAISYESIGNIKFKYRLNGLSDKWVETESPEINFSGLSPGKYLLEAYAVNFKGHLPGKPSVLSIIIYPAFWQTVWFKVAVAVFMVALLLYSVYRLVITKKNKLYNSMQQKKRLAELELEAIKAQINPHFVFNCLNSIQYFSYKNDIESVKQCLDIFAKLIRQTMQYSQETFITLGEEINYLENYLTLEKVRFKEKLKYTITVEKGVSPYTVIPSMLVQPYVENAIKHGIAKLNNSGEVWIRFTLALNNCIKVFIEDNGPGIQQPAFEPGRKSLGMRITGHRAQNYNQLFGLDIRIQIKARENAKGVCIELTIPPIKK